MPVPTETPPTPSPCPAPGVPPAPPPAGEQNGSQKQAAPEGPPFGGVFPVAMLPGIVAAITNNFAHLLRDEPEKRDACPHRRVFDDDSAAEIRLALENSVLYAGRATRVITDALLDLPHEDPRREALYDLQRLTLQQFDFASHHLAIAEKAGLT